MDRRSFLFGLAGLVGAGAAGTLALSSAEATPLAQLKDITPLDAAPEGADLAGMTPDGTPVESVWHNQWHRPGPPPPVRRRRRRVQVCRTVRDRRGRRIRTCRYEWRYF